MTTEDQKKANKERQRRHREKLAAANRGTMTVWVHEHQLPGLKDLVRALIADPDLEAGPAKSVSTGRLRSVRHQ